MPTITRRHLIGAGTAGLVTAALPGLTEQAAASDAARPNILWFISEDNNPYIGAFGDTLANTPTIDKLAREGVLFETAYSPAPVCAPSRFTYLTGVHAESVGPAHNHRARATLPDFIKGFPEYLRTAGYYTTNNSKTDYNADVDIRATWDESSNRAHWRNRPAGAPFFAQFTVTTTHESQLFSVTEGAVKPADVAVSPFLPDTPEIRADQASYYNLIERMDAQLASRLQELEDEGVAEDTIVFYFADNGGALPFSKRFGGDHGHHIPLIIKVPPKWKHLTESRSGERVSTPVQGVDFAPTALSLAGINPPEHLQGHPIIGRRIEPQTFAFGQRNRMDERYDFQRTARSEHFVYIRNYFPWRPYGQYVTYQWRQRGYQIWHQRHLDGHLDETQEVFWSEKPYEELYDIRTDTYEIHNLAADPQYRGVLEKHRHALDKHILATNDNGFIPEGHPLQGWTESRKPHAYPLQRILRVADTAARRETSAARSLLRWLDDDHDVVRFWAANGFLGLGTRAVRHADDLAERFEAESSVFVRIPLAEFLAATGSRNHVEALVRILADHGNEWVQLQALNALTYVGLDILRPHRNDIVAAAKNGTGGLKNAGRYLVALLDGTFDPNQPLPPLP